LGLLKNKNHDDSVSSDLKVPNSLPETLIEEYGLENGVNNIDTTDHPQKIPRDILEKKDFFDKIHDNSSKIEFLKESVDEEQKREEKPAIEDASNKIKSSNLNISDKKEPVLDEQDYKIVDLKQKEDKKVNYSSFFAELERLLSKSNVNHDNLSDSLVVMMKKFHDARSGGRHFFFHEQEIEESLYKKMLKLKELEEEWIIRAREYNSAKELLEEKEKEIGKLSDELKFLIRKVDRFKLFSRKVPHDKAFHLSNGKVLTCLNDLVHELEFMDDSVFHHHVTSRRNDFASWADHVLNNGKLAALMKPITNKDDLVDFLKNY
jgi:hypothetical protein